MSHFLKFYVFSPSKTKATFLIPSWKNSPWEEIITKNFLIVASLIKHSYSSNEKYPHWDLLILIPKPLDLPSFSSKSSSSFLMTSLSLSSFRQSLPLYTGEPSSVLPNTLSEALKLPDASKFIDSYMTEISTLQKLNFAVVVDRPQNKKIVGSRLVFRIKFIDGILQKYKCRFCARGYTQIFGIDYNLTYSPVILFPSLRILLSICLHMNLKTFHLDVEAAFPNADLKEEIYIELPEGHAEYDNKGRLRVLKLLKSLYGLKQAGLNWHDFLSAILLDFGFKRSEVDTCLYVYNKNNNYCIIGVYVDDIPGGVSSPIFLKEIIAFISLKVKVTSSDLIQLLGIQISNQSDYIEFSMKHYILKVLKDFNLESCKSQDTPLSNTFKIDFDEVPSDFEKIELSKMPYANIVGILLWISRTCRPDISCAVAILGRFTSNYSSRHYKALIGVLKYLKGSIDRTLRFNKLSVPIWDQLICYSDSDYAGDLTDRHSTSGFLVFYNGCLISWGCTKQDVVAQSSTEAEFIAMNTTGKYLKQLVESIGIPNVTGILYEDNTGSIPIAENPICKNRTKHIEVRFYYIRDVVRKYLKIIYKETSEQLADIFTKPLSFKIFNYLTRKIMYYSN